MGGFFGAISHKNCIYDVFFGTDYHSHLGTRRAGLAFYDTEKGFQRQIHSIENTPFRTKFDDDMAKFSGNAGIGTRFPALRDGTCSPVVSGRPDVRPALRTEPTTALCSAEASCR